MRSISVFFVVAAALAPTAGAASQETEGPTGIRTLIRDSAGTRIIENARPPEGSRLDWRLGPEPLVSIGRMEGGEPYLFHRVFGATLLSDGRIVVGDDGPKELRVFDRNGEYLETWGGQGEGPGEFGGAQLWGMERLAGDSILVWHFWYPELTVFGPNGEFVRRFIPERSRWDNWDRRSHLWPLSVSRGGLILAGQDDVYFDPAEVEVWDAGGRLRGSLGAHPARESSRAGDEDGGPLMFGDYVYRRAWGDLFIISSNRRYEIKAFAVDGSLARIVRMEHVPREPAEVHIEAYIGERLSRIPSERTDRLAERRRELRSMPVAEHLPAFAAVRGDDALGYLWVFEYEAPGEETAGTLFNIFDSEGRVLGYFEIPEGMAIMEIGADYVLARVENDLGVHSVQLLPFERGSR
ncbi:MAG: hypothetical protein F4X60_09655 [Gemmatimonadetes bacterium]|nr:hypothetical protein [Gemmatimonadota bacterium]MYB98807.1 hypothetical protein [Gemmatimonadota bacterium]